MHWQSAISAIRQKRLELARIDPRGGMPVMPPPGASPGAIAAAERRLGFPLPPSYRAFLAAHDGWPRLFHGASLLGTQHLARGTFVAVARMTIEENAAAHEAPPSVSSADFIPFGLDASADVLLAWNTARPRADGELEITVWLNQVGEVVESFPDFLELLLEMLSADVIDSEARRARATGGAFPRVEMGRSAASRPDLARTERASPPRALGPRIHAA